MICSCCGEDYGNTIDDLEDHIYGKKSKRHEEYTNMFIYGNKEGIEKKWWKFW